MPHLELLHRAAYTEVLRSVSHEQSATGYTSRLRKGSASEIAQAIGILP